MNIKDIVFVKKTNHRDDGIIRRIIRILGTVSAVVYPLLCYFFAEYVMFKATVGADGGLKRLLTFLDARTKVVVSMIFLLYFAVILMWFLFRRAAVANSVLGVAVIVASLVNYYKYILTGDNFYPWDLLNAGNLGDVAGFVDTPPTAFMILGIVALTALAVIQYFGFTDMRVRYYVRLPVVILLMIPVLYISSSPARSDRFVERCGMSFTNTGVQQSNYLDNGLIGGFTINLLSMHVPTPGGYSRNAVDAYLDGYEEIGVSDDFNSPDIIVILSESFLDPKWIPGSTFHDREGNEVDPIANFTEIASRPGTYSGRFVSSATGGGTIRPEFEVLTGLSVDVIPSGCTPYRYLSSDLPSYISRYKDMGYSTFLVHPYRSDFYSRSKGYPYIGVDDLNFEDEIYERSNTTDWQWIYRAGHISDRSFVEYIEMKVDEAQTPAFVMGISMQAHQPYDGKYTDDGLTVIAENSALSESSLYTFRRYTMSMWDADRALGELVGWIDGRERDTVLVYFGDHSPTLGANFAAYVESGLISSLDRPTQEDQYATQTTPFLIYANYELNESTILKEGSDNVIVSNNLLNAASQLIGSGQTKYMQFVEDMYHVCPTYNSCMLITPDEELRYYIDGMKMITYDRIFGKGYSNDK